MTDTRCPEEIAPQALPGFRVRWALLGWRVNESPDGFVVHTGPWLAVDYAKTSTGWRRTAKLDVLSAAGVLLPGIMPPYTERA